MTVIDGIWFGRGVLPSAARAALAPLSWAYGVGVAWRARRFDHLQGAVVVPPIPALSLGNLSVGGTGKTPVAAWAARQLRARGAFPSIVMRGYGEDEPLVHARLNPSIPVVVSADRVAGAHRAAAAGADCVILDDAFQHRRIARVSDWVLISAEQWREELRVLPAGPLREPVSALARADMLLVTRKSASASATIAVAESLRARFPRARVATCHLALTELENAITGERKPLGWLEGRRLVGTAAVGVPSAFFAQLRAEGAQITPRSFRDHHRFSDGDIGELVREGSVLEGVVCTLKDAVKLAPRWPPAAVALWYVSQNVVIESGEAELDSALEAVLAARHEASPTAG